MSIIRNGLLSADLDVPVVLPTLNLDFANSQELDPRITFTRGSIGTFVNRNGLIETIPANVPRFDYDPISGECKGLLIEESRTNLVTYSDDHSNGVWIGQGISAVSSNTIVAPDGTLTADKIVGTLGQRTRQSIYQSVSVTSGVKYTFSRFLKAGERKYVCMWFDNPNITEGAYFGAYTYVDLELGRIVFNSNSNVSITEYPNKWYRFTISATPSFTGTLSLNTSMGTPNNYLDVGTPDIYKYVGDGNSGFYTWGAQVEAGAFPTSYIPTGASTVTRSADLASMTGTNFSSWYNSSEGSIFFSGRTGNSIEPSLLTFSDTSSLSPLNFLRFTYQFLASRFIGVYSSSGMFSIYSSNTFSSGSFFKTISTYKLGGDVTIAANGKTVVKNTSKVIPTVNRLNLGDNSSYANYLNGTISRLTYYPKALSPSQLQYLTQ
jgi:hypothetical protein